MFIFRSKVWCYITKNINEQIKDVRSQTVYNIGKSAKIGAEYIQQLNDRL